MDKRCVSEVIGVILMVAITVAIAATVYLYVGGFFEGGLSTYNPNDIDVVISGNITEKFRTGQTGYLYYYFVLDNSFDINVNETIYYSFNVGDFYEG